MKLVLAVGQHDADYVDAFYGPPEWRTEAEAAKMPLADDRPAGRGARSAISPASPATPPAPRDAELWALRRQYLARQLAALRARVAMLQGKKLTFDEESRALYDAVAPTKTEAEFEAVLKQLDAKLPGDGLADRALRSLQAGVRHPDGTRRSRVPGGDSRLPRAHAAARRAAAGGDASRSSTSPTSPGAATTGTRATTRA